MASTRFFGLGGGLPKTGQTTEYQAGDDGTYEKGSPVNPRFVDNGDGTISDRATGLQWVKQPELIIPGASVIASNQIQVAHGNYANAHAYNLGDLVKDAAGDNKYYVCIVAHTSDGANIAADLVNNPASWIVTPWTASAADLLSPAAMGWVAGITDCEALIYAGKNDWRLPNVLEIVSLIDFSVQNPSIDAAKFPNTQFGSVYCTSTTAISDTSRFHGVTFTIGDIWDGASKMFGGYIRPVRGGI